MGVDLLSAFFTWVYEIVKYGSSIAGVVIGMLIAVSKTKSTRPLGISYMLSALNTLTGYIFGSLLHFLSVKEIYGFQYTRTIITLALTLASTYFICRFIHKNYDKKFIYIPMFLLPILTLVLTFLSNRIFSNHKTWGSDTGYLLNLGNLAVSLISATVSTVIIVVVLFKNRKIEKVVPYLWLLRIFSYIFTCFSYAFTSTAVVIDMVNADVPKRDLAPFASFFMNSYSTMNMFLGIISALVSLIIPLYVLINARSCAKKQQMTAQSTEMQ